MATERDITTVGEIRSYTGRWPTPLNLKPADVCVEDVAHSLSLICRFGGHCSSFFSVAEHSIMVAQRVPPKFRLTALLHDATEAYLGDMVRPVKRHPDMAAYCFAETIAHIAVHTALGGTFPHDPIIKQADDEQLAWEFDHMRDVKGRAWMTPIVAERAFLNEYWRLVIAQATPTPPHSTTKDSS
jgi:hypothetical protein